MNDTDRHGEIMRSLGILHAKQDATLRRLRKHDEAIEELQAFRSRMKGAGSLGGILVTFTAAIAAWYRGWMG